jgi:hypothetical protein
MIASEMFSEQIPDGDYIFSATSLGELLLMFIEMKKIIQYTASKR